MYPFERFTESAKRALTLAQEEAERSHHSYIGTEHLLLGIMRTDGIAAQALANLGVEIEAIRAALERIIGRSENACGPVDHPHKSGQESDRVGFRGGPHR